MGLAEKGFAGMRYEKLYMYCTNGSGKVEGKKICSLDISRMQNPLI